MRNTKELLSLLSLISSEREKHPDIDIKSLFKTISTSIWEQAAHSKLMEMPQVTSNVLLPSDEQECRKVSKQNINKILRGLDALEANLRIDPSLKKIIKDDFRFDLEFLSEKSPTLFSTNEVNLFEETTEGSSNTIAEAVKTAYQMTLMMSDFVEKVIDCVASSYPLLQRQNHQPILNRHGIAYHYTQCRYNEVQLRLIYNELIKNKWINSTTTQSDFIYYFTGVGETPLNRLRWNETHILYGLFINKMVDDRNIYSISAKITELYNSDHNDYFPINRKVFKAATYRALGADISQERFKKIETIITNALK